MKNNTEASVSKLRTVMNMMFSPGTALKKAISDTPFYFSLIVSGLAFGLFFLQTGLDLYKTGQQSLVFALSTAFIGALFGMIAVPLISIFIWGVAKPFGSDKSMQWTISAFCLSYSGALVYSIFGIVANLIFGWRTAVAFGVTGVIWATAPMIVTIREMIGGKILLCVVLATVTGSTVLFCWSFIGKY